jgi:small ligand-binding sensory domain FIST
LHKSNRFLSAHAAANRWQDAAEVCLATLGAIPADANVGFLYVTDTFARELPEIFTYLKERTAVSHWTGTVGTGICGNGREYHDEPAISLLIGSFPEDRFRILPPLTDKPDAFVRAERTWLARHDHHFGILHADPRAMQVPKLLGELGEALRGGFLVGGLTSSRTSYPQIADGMVEGALSGILFDADVPVATALTQSCAPFGDKHTITQCQRNIAIRLDDRPALDVFREEIGEVLARTLTRAAQTIGVALPVRGSDTGDYLVRNLMGVDENNNLLAIGEMLSTGQPLQFCRRDPASAEADLRRMLRELKARAPQPKGGVFYSCVGRGPNLFGTDSGELRIIQEELGDLPLTGFYCNGEISHNRLYGYTGVLTLFL